MNKESGVAAKRVYIIEDNRWLREILVKFLSMQVRLEVCGSAATAEEALQTLPAGADVITVDLSLGHGLSGLKIVEILRERWPEIPCVVLSGAPEIHLGNAAKKAGAAGFVEKGDEERLVQVLYEVLGIAEGTNA